jgi:hypothetical protein
MQRDEFQLYAKAEALLNATLAYQAAIAVQQLKDLFDLRVKELRLSVAPENPDHPSILHVTCTIQALEEEAPLEVSVSIDPKKAVIHRERTGATSPKRTRK